MNNLVLVGGIQYSGKTRFCSDLTKHGYEHHDLDAVGHYLENNREVFFRNIKKSNRAVYDVIRKLGRKHHIEDKGNQIVLFANEMINRGQGDAFFEIQQETGIFYVGKLIKQSQKIPIIDGAFVNKVSREKVYGRLSSVLQPIYDFQEMPKLFVHFNQGLDLSIERFKNSTRLDKKRCSEDYIRSMYAMQEIPSEDELPNLEVLVIKKPEEVPEALEKVREFCLVKVS